MNVAAIDIGGTKIAVGLVNEQGALLGKVAMQTSAAEGLANGLTRIQQSILNLQQECRAEIEGIGIACTGPVDPITGELAPNTFLPGWEGTALVNGLANSFALPIAMENDADAAALAEFSWGSGAGCSNFIYLTVSTGIGAGLIINGRLFRGVGGAHPEVGHHTIDPSGPLCFCGSHGCWEVLASGPAMARWYYTQFVAAELDARQICEAARGGHLLAQKAVAREAHYLGLGLANLITLYTPDRISLGGGVMHSWDLFEPAVREIIQTNCGLVPFARTQIAFASLGPDVNLLGAAQAWFHRYPSNH
jgi:glucokinase